MSKALANKKKLGNVVDVVADFGADPTGATDSTTAIQAAIAYAWSLGVTLKFPSGTFLTTGITVNAGSTSQGKVLHLEGEGGGNPFTISTPFGTLIKCTTNAPILQVMSNPAPMDSGTIIIKGFKFWSTSATNTFPVIYLQAFYGIGEFSHNTIYQAGTGNGLQVDYMATSEIHNCYFLNRDLVTGGLGVARVGVGCYINLSYDAGLQTIRKCSSRGFNTGFKLGNEISGGVLYSASVQECESSYNYTGIWITPNAKSTTVNACYLEGGDGGYGIWDQGDYGTVTNNFCFAGFSTHLKSTDFTYGNNYSGNTFAAQAVANQVLIDITSSSASGGPGKTCSGNHLSFGGSGGSVAGVIGVRINGTDPRINLLANNFYPRNSWVGGAGTTKISDLSTGGVYGMTTAISGLGSLEIPMLSRGALSLEIADGGLSQFNVSGGILTLPGGSLFNCNATVATPVSQLSAGNTAGRFLIFRCENTNLTFSSSAYIILNGAVSFASRGHIVFYTAIIGGITYAYELCRSTF